MELDDEEEVTNDEHEHHVVPAAGTTAAAELAEGSSRSSTMVSKLVHMDMLFVPFLFFISYPSLTFCSLRKGRVYP